MYELFYGDFVCSSHAICILYCGEGHGVMNKVVTIVEQKY